MITAHKFNKGTFDLPANRPLPNQGELTPCILIGDEGFLLKEFLMRPFPHHQSRIDERKEKFYKRLCRVHYVVENGFGILFYKWRILFRPIEKKNKIYNCCKACLCVTQLFPFKE